MRLPVSYFVIVFMSESERVNVDDSILDALLSETSHDISQQELRFITFRALGCVGADLSVIHSNSLRTTLPAHCRPFLRFLFFDTPPVRYSDINGEVSTIQKFREAVEWPLLYPKIYTRLGM